jgi:hypothetical protein
MSTPDTLHFNFFERVWLQIDEDGSSPGMGQVIGILYKPTGAILYQVQWRYNEACYHYAEELSRGEPCEFSPTP